MVPLVIHLIRHADAPCGLTPLDELLGGGLPCRALSKVSLCLGCKCT